MSSLLSSIGDFISGAITWLHEFIKAAFGYFSTSGSDVTWNSGSDILLLFIVCVPLVGLGIGLLKRLISTRG